jgi:glycine/serine hydroxymethyltransferase
MSLDHAIVGFTRFAHFDKNLEPKCYSRLFHSSTSPSLVVGLDSYSRSLGARDARQIHQTSSQVLLVKSAPLGGAFAGSTFQNSLFAARFLPSSSHSPRAAMFLSHADRRTAAHWETTLTTY